ncbi:MAG: hypothetical protein ACE5HS_17125 [bacterium]
MRYSDWTTLANTETEAPAQNGLFQIKVKDGLVNYPRGKSAMFYYGFAENLSQGLQNFRSRILPLLEVNESVLLIRWLATENTEAQFQNYLNSFFNNFGALPLGNEMQLHKQYQNQQSEG